jgi:hypothetical protein
MNKHIIIMSFETLKRMTTESERNEIKFFLIMKKFYDILMTRNTKIHQFSSQRSRHNSKKIIEDDFMNEELISAFKAQLSHDV